MSLQLGISIMCKRTKFCCLCTEMESQRAPFCMTGMFVALRSRDKGQSSILSEETGSFPVLFHLSRLGPGQSGHKTLCALLQVRSWSASSMLMEIVSLESHRQAGGGN